MNFKVCLRYKFVEKLIKHSVFAVIPLILVFNYFFFSRNEITLRGFLTDVKKGNIAAGMAF